MKFLQYEEGQAIKGYINTILTVWLFCTEKYKPEVDNAARACEGCILTEGLYFEVRTAKQLVLDLLTGRIYFKLYFYYHSSVFHLI